MYFAEAEALEVDPRARGGPAPGAGARGAQAGRTPAHAAAGHRSAPTCGCRGSASATRCARAGTATGWARGSSWSIGRASGSPSGRASARTGSTPRTSTTRTGSQPGLSPPARPRLAALRERGCGLAEPRGLPRADLDSETHAVDHEPPPPEAGTIGPSGVGRLGMERRLSRTGASSPRCRHLARARGGPQLQRPRTGSPRRAAPTASSAWA